MSNEQEKAAEDIFAGVTDKKAKAKGVVETQEEVKQSWDDYVMSLFEGDEVVEEDGNKFVRVDGLRRVAPLVLGDYVYSGPIQVFPSMELDAPGRATVLYKVEFANGQTFTEVADCWWGNTDDKFLPHTVAVASTKAEARALRKALRIKAVSLEEITRKDTAQISRQATQNAVAKKPTDGDTSDEILSDRQDNFINTLCDRAEVDREKFISTVLNIKNPGKLTKRIASEAIDLLNSYTNKTVAIPDSIKR